MRIIHAICRIAKRHSATRKLGLFTIAELELKVIKELKLLVRAKNANVTELAVQDPTRYDRLDNVGSVQAVHAVGANNRSLLQRNLLNAILAKHSLEVSIRPDIQGDKRLRKLVPNNDYFQAKEKKKE